MGPCGGADRTWQLRNWLVVMDVDAVIAFPGGYGALIEFGFALAHRTFDRRRRRLATGRRSFRAARGSAEEAVAYALSAANS